MPRPRAAILPALLLAATGCADGVSTPAETLRVAAAADLEAALPDLRDAFRARTGLAVDVVLGSSGTLARQVEQGAPFDLFLSANRAYVERLAAAGAIEPASVRDYARGALALVVLDELADTIGSLDDLREPAVRRVAIANPDHAPYGVAARRALESAGLLDAVGPKLVPAENVRQALQFVTTGNAEAGLVALPIADLPGVREVPGVRTLPVDEALHAPIVQALGVVASAREPGKARAFADFLLSGEGRAILARHGFRPPPDAGDGP